MGGGGGSNGSGVMRIGLVGTGMLGGAVGMRLLDKGYKLAAYNRTPGKAAALGKRGARICGTPGEAARHSDLVITAVRDAGAVRDVVFGDDGIASGARGGRVAVADMSTINPAESGRIAARLADECGMPMLDIPVMGGPNVAVSGGLVMMVSGDAATYEAFGGVLDAVARKVFYLGGRVGTAHSVKLAMNLQISMLALALSEGITLTRAAGIDPEVFLKILNSTYFKTGMSENKAHRMIAGSFSPTFTLENLEKDLRTINDAAGSLGAKLPMADRAGDMYRNAVDAGLGGLDYTGIIEYIGGLADRQQAPFGRIPPHDQHRT